MLIDRIRQALNTIHAEIEQTETAKAMIAGRVDRNAYCAMLQQLGALHESLEKCLQAVNHPLYRHADMARADVIQRDLVALNATASFENVSATSVMIDQFQTWAKESPWSLIGALYVFEGSRMGSMALVRPVAKALGVDVRPGTGVDYHLDGMATRPMAWGRFKAELAATAFSDEQANDVVNAARITMDALFHLYRGEAISTNHTENLEVAAI